MLNKIKKLLHISEQNKEEISTVTTVPVEQINELFDELNCDVIRVEIGVDFCSFGECLCNEIYDLRKEIKESTGFILPVVHVLSNDEIQENECVIYIKEKIIYDDFLLPTQEDLTKQVIANLKELSKTHIEDIFTNELAEKYMDAAWKNNYRLVTQLGYVLSSVNIRNILVELLKNNKSIKNIDYIFEKIAEAAKPEEFPCHVKDPYVIAERVCKCI